MDSEPFADGKAEIRGEKMELEEFFHSSWYEILCEIDPDKVIVNCRRRAEEQERESIRQINRIKVQKLAKATVLHKETEMDKAHSDSTAKQK